MDFRTVRDNLARVQDSIARVQAREGLVHRVTVIAVTKGHSGEAVQAVVQAGATDVGENRVQEGVAKKEELGDLPVKWHLIGHLQTNKTKFVPGAFSVVHSVDSVRVARALDTACARGDVTDGERLRVLVQVNIGEEHQKSGCRPEEVALLAEDIRGCDHLQLDGLMTMAPLSRDERLQRSVFAKLRELRDGLQASGLRVPDLSMGMSGDFEAAVAEGATMVRLGTVLFGERRP